MSYYARQSRRRLNGLGDAGLPAGSRLAYTATWGNNFTSWNDPNAIQAGIQSNLAQQYGVIIDGQTHYTSDLINTSGRSGFTLQVHTVSDRNSGDDVQAIIDGAIWNLTGFKPQSQYIIITAGGANPLATIPAGPLPPQPQPPSSLTDWLSANWIWLALAGVGVVVAEDIL